MAGIDQYTKMMLHFDGLDATTSILNSNVSGPQYPWTITSPAQLDTAIYRFGNASLLCGSSSGFGKISTPASSGLNLGSGDFTVDLQFQCTAISTRQSNLCGQTDATINASNTSFYIYKPTTGFFIQCAVGWSGGAEFGSTVPYTSSEWHHLALVRSGSTLSLYIDGIQRKTQTSVVGSVTDSQFAFSIGGIGESGAAWSGSVDEFRLSVGIARWTANFTPPVSMYSYVNTTSVFNSGPTSIQQGNTANFAVEFLDANGSLAAPSSGSMTITYDNLSGTSVTETIALTATNGFYSGSWSSTSAATGLADWEIVAAGSSTVLHSGQIRVINRFGGLA